MAKHLRILGSLLVFLALYCTTLHADEYTPTYDFDGVITVLGLNPTCGASSFPCTETIDISLDYYIDLQPPVDAGENFFIVPGTLSASASGPLGPVGIGGLFLNEFDFTYQELFFPQAGIPCSDGLSFPECGGPTTEFDLNIDPLVLPAGSFNADTYFCTGECNALFGGFGGNFSLPTTLDYEITPVSTPEPGTLSSLALGLGGLGLLVGLRKRRLHPFVAARTITG